MTLLLSRVRGKGVGWLDLRLLLQTGVSRWAVGGGEVEILDWGGAEEGCRG